MKHPRLPLLGSTKIYTDRIPLFTCVLRCHTSSLEGRRTKPIKLTQQREINLPAKPLANANVHRLLKPGTCGEIELDVSSVCIFLCLVKIQGAKQQVRYDCAIGNNWTKIIDKNINMIKFSLTVLGKTNREISVEIQIKVCLISILEMMRYS